MPPAKQQVEIGQRYNALVTICKLPEKIGNEEAWLCRCDCGEETKATKHQLLSARKKSCGCLRKQSPPNALDLTDKRFGKLVAIKRAGKTKNENALWLCHCDCGNTVKANATTLRRGEIISCGCDRPSQAEAARKVLRNQKTIDGAVVPLLTKKVRSDSETGHKGIYKRGRNDKITYEANITIKGKRYYAGPFNNLEDAIAARKHLEYKHHKPYIEALEGNDGQKNN